MQKSREEALKDLVIKYYDQTESYDRTVCTGEESKYGIMPATQDEFYMVRENAKQMFREISEEAQKLGYSTTDVRQALKNYVTSGELEENLLLF